MMTHTIFQNFSSNRLRRVLALGLCSSLCLATTGYTFAAPANRGGQAKSSGDYAKTSSQASSPEGEVVKFGPPISGICAFSEDAALAKSKVGDVANQRIRQLAAAVQSELGPEQAVLDADIKSYQSTASSLSQDQQQQKGQALQKRMQDFEAKRNLRQKELETTLRKAFVRIGSEMDPIVRNIIATRPCALLLKADSVYGVNPEMDITQLVIGQLDNKLTSISFDREHLDQASPPTTISSKK